MDIYTILSSKPHNPHYLKRYVAFIKNCKLKNTEHNIKIHKHHICPRAKDMFPEYKSFANHKWNCAKLTPRQHFIAHILLWKMYPNFLSPMNAIWQMKHKNKESVNSKLYESLINDYRKAVSLRFKNKISVYDRNGNYLKVLRKDYNPLLYTSISANRIVARNNTGEYEVVDIDTFKNRDDLVGTTSGMKIWNNGVYQVFSFSNPGIDFIQGPLPLTIEQKKLRTEKRMKTLSERYTPEELSFINSSAQKKYWSTLSEDQRKKSEKTKNLMSISATKNNPGFSVIFKCPNCGKEAQKANISKWHGIDGKKCKW